MARRPFQENNADKADKVNVVMGTGCNIGGQWVRPGDVVAMTPQDAADYKSLRMARDLTAEEVAVDGYLRRDMRAR